MSGWIKDLFDTFKGVKTETVSVSKEVVSLYETIAKMQNVSNVADIDLGQVNWKTLREDFDLTDESFLKWVKDTEESKRTFANYQMYVKSSSNVTGKFKTALNSASVAIKAFGASLASVAVSMAIGMVIEAIITGIYHLINAEKEAEEAFENAKETSDSYYESLQETASEGKKSAATLKGLISSYAELSEGIGQNNKNVSLSTDEYTDFLEMNEKIADLCPTLIQGYDEQGNAILNIGNNAKETTEKLQAQYKAMQVLNQQKTEENIKNYFEGDDDSDGQLAVSQTIKEELADKKAAYQGALSALNKTEGKYNTYQDVINDIQTSKTLDLRYVTDIQELLDKNKSGINLVAALGGMEQINQKIQLAELNEEDPLVDVSSLNLPNIETDKIDETIYNEVKNTAQELQNIQTEADNYNQKSAAVIMQWVTNQKLYTDNEDLQEAIQSMVESVDYINTFDEDSTLKDIENYITDTILTPLQTACNDPEKKEQVISAYQQLFSPDTSKLSTDELKEQTDNYIAILAEALGTSKKTLKVTLGFNVKEDEWEATKKNVEDKYTGIDTSKYSQDDLDTLSTQSKDYVKQKLTQENARLLNNGVTDDSKRAEKAVNNVAKALIKEANAAEKAANSTKFTRKSWEGIADLADNDDNKAIKNAQSALQELAEQGELTKKTFKSTSGSTSILKYFGYDETEIDRMIDKINELVSSTSQLSSMKTGISSISEILSTKKSNPNSAIGADTLAGMPDELKECTKEYENFVQTLGTSSSSMAESQAAANKLATAYVSSNNFLANLTAGTKDYYVSQLKEMGVSNANEVVTNALAAKTLSLKTAKKLVAKAGVDVTNQTASENAALLKQGNYSQQTQAAIRMLWMEENIFNNNKLDVHQKVEALTKYAKALGQTALIAKAQAAATKYAGEQVKKNNGSMSNWSKDWSKKFNEIVKNGLTVLDQIETDVSPDDKKNTNTNSDPSGTPSSSSSSSTKETVDWISRRLDILQNKIDLTAAKFENLFSLKKQKNNLAKQIKLTTDLIDAQKKAVKKYTAKANKIKLSSKLKKAVREGRVNGSLSSLIATYDESTANKITKYQDYYDKAQSAKKSVQSSRTSKRNLQEQQYQLYVDQAESKISAKEAQAENQASAKAKNKLLAESVEWIEQEYKYQIKIAELSEDWTKRAQLRAEKSKALLENKTTQLQNYADEYEANATLAQQQEEIAAGASAKNKLEKDYISNIKKQYKKLEAIAKAEGDITEQKRLQAELTQKISETALNQFNNISDEYSQKTSTIDHRSNIYDSEISLLEARGGEANARLYNNLAQQSTLNANVLSQELQSLIKTRNEKWINGELTTDDFNTMTEQIYSTTEAWLSAKTSAENYAKSAREAIRTFNEESQSMIDELNNEANFYKTLLNYKDMYNDNGDLTDEGKSVFALDVYEIGTNQAKVNKYKLMIQDLNKQYKNGEMEYAEYISKFNEYTNSMRDAEEEIYSLKDSMKDLIEDGLNAQKDALDELIDKYKDALSEASDLRDYQNTVEEETKNIASLQKQLEVAKGINTEEGRAKVQQLQVDLADAQKELEDTEYDKYISDQEDMLDDLSEDFEDFIEQQLDNIDSLLEQIIQTVELNGSDMTKALHEISETTGIDLSETLSQFGITPENATVLAEAFYNQDNAERKQAGNSYNTEGSSIIDGEIQNIEKANMAKDEKAAATAKQKAEATAKAQTNTQTNANQQRAINAVLSSIGKQVSANGDRVPSVSGSDLEINATKKYIKNWLANAGRTPTTSDQSRIIGDPILEHLSTSKKVRKIKGLENGLIISAKKEKALAKLFGISDGQSAWKKRTVKALQAIGYSQGGIVGKKILQQNHDDVFGTLSVGERVLKPVDSDSFQIFNDYLPELVKFGNQITSLEPVDISNNAFKATQSPDVTVGDITIQLDGSNVVDADSLNDAIKHSDKIQNTIANAVGKKAFEIR